MKIHRLDAAPPLALADALEAFERQFVYPLGPGRSFRISHGRDYARFFRAIGGERGVSFVATEDSGEVLGTIGVALREVQWPDGSRRLAAYVGDLKTVRDLRCAKTLVRLAAAAFAWGRPLGAVAVYGIVMDGTPRSPSSYSGRFGIPAFQAISALRVLRIPLDSTPAEDLDAVHEIAAGEVGAIFAELSARRGAFAGLGGAPVLRAAIPACGLLASNRLGCGVLEDTRLAKRLIGNDGVEMSSAHLSQFASADPVTGLAVIRAALARASRQPEFSALFVSLPAGDDALFQSLRAAFPDLVEAPATIFGAGLPAGGAWDVSTSEI